MLILSWVVKDSKEERGAMSDLGFCPDSTPMLIDNAVHVCQAGAFEFMCPVHTLKYAREFVGIFQRKGDAVITDEEYPFRYLVKSYPLNLNIVS